MRSGRWKDSMWCRALSSEQKFCYLTSSALWTKHKLSDKAVKDTEPPSPSHEDPFCKQSPGVLCQQRAREPVVTRLWDLSTNQPFHKWDVNLTAKINLFKYDCEVLKRTIERITTLKYGYYYFIITFHFLRSLLPIPTTICSNFLSNDMDTSLNFHPENLSKFDLKSLNLIRRDIFIHSFISKH